MVGTLYGIGVGPGDPELITVKAFRKLKESNVIAYPKKRRGSKSYAQKIIDVYVNTMDKEMLGLVFPMTKDEDILEKYWNETAETIAGKLLEGKDLAFVTEGDPLLYSTFIHLFNIMKEKYPQIPMQVVPGISSFNGTAARLGLPLVDGDEQLAIIPATDNKEEMKNAIENHDCVIFLKVAKVIDSMIENLKELDLLHAASVVTKVTSDEEIIWNIEECVDADLNYLTLMVVRK
ncbi:precorrin-2/cobalt-factor-2 C20-methyltransferase [Oikeobacillus pervagus]|uniref:Precorrin-2/cobalt-factor-2 C20-methyltransferase n=1 Tax=Oikeobacillus pervagus TaxID=1325931 RepID=A0AAJ1WID2_9BACI|nr:precorrin-2 C(20)-methyltransferase [Oikeobacillus pervagus]MDQ0214228.1 precorrin-2/cobalt-factor-2 C20-methyltransferase [Oikeobacillus pervagus]